MQFQPVAYPTFQDIYSRIYPDRKFSSIVQPVWDHAYKLYTAHIYDIRPLLFFIVESILRFKDCQLPNYESLKNHFKNTTSCVIQAAEFHSIYFCPEELFFRTIVNSVTENIKNRVLSISLAYKKSIFCFYETYCFIPYEVNLLMQAHNSIIERLDSKLTYYQIITVLSNRLEPRVSQFCHFLLYEINNYSSKATIATTEGVQIIISLITIIRVYRFKSYLKLYPLYPQLRVITGRPIGEERNFPSLKYLTQVPSTPLIIPELEFITMDTLMGFVLQLQR